MTNKPLSLEALESLKIHTENGFAESVLVAPNKTIQKLWQKEYPGYKVLLSQKLPTQRNRLDEFIGGGDD